jgi:hypothetical protein
MSVLGKDDKGRVWFKSDWYLSDITEAIDFKVTNESFLWSKWFKLVATVPYNKEFHGTMRNSNGYEYSPKYYDQTIGWYKSLQQASMALENLMPLLGIHEISPIDGMPYMRKNQ